MNTVRQESHRVRSLGLRLATLLLLGGLGWGLFGPFLSLPYLFDDPVVLRAARDARWAEIWTSLRWPVGYYRPLGLTLWKAADLLWREGAVFVLRGLGLTLHIFNAALVGLLYRRISGSGSRWVALLAAFWFLLFPFSLQAVIYPSALIHPLVAFLALLGALLASTHTLRGMVGALFPVALAPFAAEHGVMAGWLVCLATVLSGKRLVATDSRVRIFAWIYGMLPMASLALWVSLAGPGKAMRGLPVADWGRNALYFLQGLITPLPQAIPAGWPAGSAALALLGLIVLGALAFVFYQSGYISVWVVGVGWYGLAVLPALLTRPFVYVMDGPRLMYLGAAGAAWIWAEGIQWLARRPSWGRILAAVGIGAVALAHGAFLKDMLEQMKAGGALVRETLRQVREVPPGSTLVFINYPSWLASSSERYPFGHEGIPLIPDYVGIGAFLHANLGESWEVLPLSFPDVLQPWRFRYGTLGSWPGWEGMAEIVQRADAVFRVDYRTEGSLRLVRVGGRRPCQFEWASFGPGSLVLCEASVERGKGELIVLTTWALRAPVHEDWTVFLHLYGPDGRLVAQEDGYLIGKTLPPRWMRVGASVQDIRRLPISPTASPGAYRIGLGVYRLDTGERVNFHSGMFVPQEDRVIPLAAIDLP